MFERFKNWFGGKDDAPRTDPVFTEHRSVVSGMEWLVGGKRSDNESYLDVPVVKACVDAIEGGVSMLPLNVEETATDGTTALLGPKDRRSRVIGRFWNDNLTARQGIRQWIHSALVYGMGYVRIGRNNRGEVISLNPLTRSQVGLSARGYVLTPHGFNLSLPSPQRQDAEIVSPDDMLVLRYDADINTHEDNALSPIDMCKDAIELYSKMQSAASNFFTNGAPQVAFKLKFEGNDSDRKKAIEDLADSIRYSNESGGQVLLPEIVDVTKLGSDPDRGQYIQQRTFQLEEICRTFNVQPSIVHDNSKATYSNNEQAYASFLTFTLQPWIERMEAEMNLKLFSTQGRNNYRVLFNTREFLRTDVNSEQTFILAAVRDGIMTSNEARAKLGLPRSDQEGADDLTKQVQNQPLAETDVPPTDGDVPEEEPTDE